MVAAPRRPVTGGRREQRAEVNPAKVKRGNSLMSRVFVAAAVLMFAPVAARAEPISVMLTSSSSAVSTEKTVNVQGSSIDLGMLTLGPDGVGTFFFNNAKGGKNYQVSLDL